jgi:hypothetical protein
VGPRGNGHGEGISKSSAGHGSLGTSGHLLSIWPHVEPSSPLYHLSLSDAPHLHLAALSCTDWEPQAIVGIWCLNASV